MTDTSTQELFFNLSEYNSQVNDVINNINQALIVVALVIISILWYVDFLDVQKRLIEQQNRLSHEIFLHVAYKYFLAICFIMLSGQIIDVLVWFGNAISHTINANLADAVVLVPKFTETDIGLDFFKKIFLNMVQGLATIMQWIAQIIIQILVFLRFLEMYLYKAFSPILVAGYISDSWKNVSLGFIKQFVALSFQSGLLILMIKLYNVLATADMFKITTTGKWEEALGQAVLFLVKSCVYIFVLVGSQNKVKKWLGG